MARIRSSTLDRSNILTRYTTTFCRTCAAPALTSAATLIVLPIWQHCVAHITVLGRPDPELTLAFFLIFFSTPTSSARLSSM